MVTCTWPKSKQIGFLLRVCSSLVNQYKVQAHSEGERWGGYLVLSAKWSFRRLYHKTDVRSRSLCGISVVKRGLCGCVDLTVKNKRLNCLKWPSKYSKNVLTRRNIQPYVVIYNIRTYVFHPPPPPEALAHWKVWDLVFYGFFVLPVYKSFGLYLFITYFVLCCGCTRTCMCAYVCVVMWPRVHRSLGSGWYT